MKRISEEEQGDCWKWHGACSIESRLKMNNSFFFSNNAPNGVITAMATTLVDKMLTVRTMSSRKQSYGQAGYVVTLKMMCGTGNGRSAK
jgi:hypothetical protein